MIRPLLAALFLVSCGVAPAPSTRQTAPPDAPASDQPFSGHRLVEKNDLLQFTYSYPPEAAMIPALAAHLEADLGRQHSEAVTTAEEDRAARTPDFPYSGHYFHQVWEVDGNTPRLLSLSAQIDTFTGGAHGNSLFAALLWDKEADGAVGFRDLFADAGAALEMLKPAFCAELDRQRAEKRQETLPLTGEGWEVECPALAESVVTPIDTDSDSRFDALDVLLPPYAAGPYAEGSYEVQVEISPALRALIKPEFASSF